MRVTIYQPRYFPQLHYFNRMLHSDTFVFLDDAQYTKSLRQDDKRTVSYQSDTPIKSAQGVMLLTIPLRHNGYSPINETHIDYLQNWDKKHLAVIKSAYFHAPYFPFVQKSLKKLLTRNYLTLAHLNVMTTLWGLSVLLDLKISEDEITLETINKKLEKLSHVRLKKIILGSSLGVTRPEGLQKGTEWTTDICLALGATEYVHGGTAKQNYMHVEYYLSHGITPIQQSWVGIPYSQQFKKMPFISNLSIIDLLCNVDPKDALDIVYKEQTNV